MERDNSEFDAQRKAVISEALQQGGGANKKTYGGGKQVTQCDNNLNKISVELNPPLQNIWPIKAFELNRTSFLFKGTPLVEA